jgi:transposase
MANNYEKAIVLMVRTSLTQREIAKGLDVTEETISRWKKRKDFED